MPAGLPGSTPAENLANPSAGRFVIFDPLSGPKGSPLDNDNAGNASTGAMCTGIGVSAQPIIGPPAPQSIIDAGFDDDQVPGTETGSSGVQNVVNSDMMYIGGGRQVLGAADENLDGEAGADPYTAGVEILGAGNGGARDAGAGPAFTGFAMKMVTATGAVANGVDIELGFKNRSGVAMVSGQSAHGSDDLATAIPS